MLRHTCHNRHLIMDEFTDEIIKIDPDRESSEKILGTYHTFDPVFGLRLFTSF